MQQVLCWIGQFFGLLAVGVTLVCGHLSDITTDAVWLFFKVGALVWGIFELKRLVYESQVH